MPKNNLAQNNNFISNQQNDFLGVVPVAPATIKYAGFWIRLAAVFLDGIILIIPNIIFLLIIQFGASGFVRAILTDFSGLLVSWFYFILMTSKYQATLGKKALGIMVVSDTSETLSLKQVIVRETIGKLISGLILSIGYIMVGFTKRKQALHDKIAGTAVIYKNPDKKVSTGVLVAIIIAFLIALIAIIGILASIVLVSLNSARYKAQDASMKANISSVFSSAILYQDENGNLAGYKPEFRMTIADCSEKPIVNISSTGKEMAIFGKLCSEEGKYFCSDMNFDYGEVEENYAKSGKFSCFDSASLLTTPAPTMITNNEIADWKSYNNKKYGFEVKYPKNWIFSAQSTGGKYDVLDMHLENSQYSDSSICDPNFIGLEIQAGQPKDQNQDFSSFVKSQIVESGLGPKNLLGEFKVNNHLGFKVQYSGWDSNCSGPGYFIEQNRNHYIYIFTGVGEESQKEGLEKFDQILSTFKFIGNKEISDWKIYNTEKSWQFASEKYTIKYPSDWSYLERRIAGDRVIGNLETTFRNNKNDVIVTVIAGDTLSKYQDKKYTNKGKVSLGSFGYKFLKLEETSLGNIIYVFDTGENIIGDSTQKGYDEVIVLSADFNNGNYLNDLVSTFEFGK